MWVKIKSEDELKVGQQVRYTGISGALYGHNECDKRFVASLSPFEIVDNLTDGATCTRTFASFRDWEVYVPDCAMPRTFKDPNAAEMDIMIGIRVLTERAHAQSRAAGWWNNLETGEAIEATQEVVGDKLMLIVTEVAEAKEGYRKSLADEHLPCRSMVEVELADAVIRIADLAGKLGLDIGAAVVEKMRYNRTRADHKIENRKKEGGKKS